MQPTLARQLHACVRIRDAHGRASGNMSLCWKSGYDAARLKEQRYTFSPIHYHHSPTRSTEERKDPGCRAKSCRREPRTAGTSPREGCRRGRDRHSSRWGHPRSKDNNIARLQQSVCKLLLYRLFDFKSSVVSTIVLRGGIYVYVVSSANQPSIQPRSRFKFDR